MRHYICIIIILVLCCTDAKSVSVQRSEDAEEHDKEIKQIRTNMDYLKEKWSVLYNVGDINHNGRISSGDVLESEQEVPIGFTQDQSESLKTGLEKWWKKYMIPMGKDKVTLDEYLQWKADDYTKNKTAFIENAKQNVKDFYGLFDFDKDNELSVCEFSVVMKSFGLNRKGKYRALFNALMPVDGKIPFENLIKYWVIYITEDNSDISDPIKDALAYGL